MDAANLLVHSAWDFLIQATQLIQYSTVEHVSSAHTLPIPDQIRSNHILNYDIVSNRIESSQTKSC